MIDVTKIGLGTVQFGLDYGISNKNGKTKVKEVNQILETARQSGIDCIDTASAYGNAEELLGNNDISSFYIVSKFMTPVNGKTISKQLNISLKKLNQNSIYAYLAHRPMDLIHNPEHWNELLGLKAKGFIKKVGFSLNEPKEIEILLEKNFQPDLIQVPYNYFDRRFENMMIELRTQGCEIHTRSTFLQGLFFINPDELSPFFDEAKPILISLQKNKNLPKSLLNFVLNRDFIDKIIIGVENNQQLLQNLNNTEGFEKLENLDAKLSNSIVSPMLWPK